MEEASCYIRTQMYQTHIFNRSICPKGKPNRKKDDSPPISIGQSDTIARRSQIILVTLNKKEGQKVIKTIDPNSVNPSHPQKMKVLFRNVRKTPLSRFTDQKSFPHQVGPLMGFFIQSNYCTFKQIPGNLKEKKAILNQKFSAKTPTNPNQLIPQLNTIDNGQSRLGFNGRKYLKWGRGRGSTLHYSHRPLAQKINVKVSTQLKAVQTDHIMPELLR